MSLLASATSRSTIASRSAISCGLVLCGRNQPSFCHCFKVILAPDDEQLRLTEHCRQEVVAGSFSLCELVHRHYMRIDLAAEFHSEARKELAKLAKGYGTDYHEIDVAVSFLCCSGNRPKNEGELDPWMSQSVSQHLGESARFQHQ